MAEDAATGPAPVLPGKDAGIFLNVNLVFTSTVLSYGVAFLVSVLVARTLGPEGRGLVSLYQSAITLIFAVLSLGAGVASLYFVSRRELTPRAAIEHGTAITLLAALITGLGLAIVAPLLGSSLVEANVPYWMLIVAVPANIQFRLVEAVLRAQGRFMAMNAVEFAQPLSLLALLLAVELTAGLTEWRALLVWGGAPLLPMTLGYLLLGPSAWPRGLPAPAALRRSAVFGVQGQLGNIVQLMTYRVDSYLVLIFVDTAGVGIYAVSAAMSEGLWFIANSVTTVLIPRLTASDTEAAATDAARACRMTMAVTALAAAALAVVSPLLIPGLFGSSFDDAVVPFLLLLPGIVTLAGGKVLSAFVLSRGRPIINSYIALAAFAVTIGADLVLIPWLEVAGAAIASSCAYTTSFILTAIAYRHLSRRRLLAALVLTPADLRYGWLSGGDLLRQWRDRRLPQANADDPGSGPPASPGSGR